jgi:hypothetical protein
MLSSSLAKQSLTCHAEPTKVPDSLEHLSDFMAHARVILICNPMMSIDLFN